MIKYHLLLLLCSTLFSARAEDFSHCFIPGEHSTYKVRWSGIPVAYSETTTEEIEEGGRKLIKIRMISKTYRAYTHLYKVDNVYETVLDPLTALPVRSDIRLNERGQVKNHLTTFDHKNKIALFMDRTTNNIKEIPISDDTRDMLSFIYYTRYPDDISKLTGIVYHIMVDGRLRTLELKQERKPKRMKLSEYGKVQSIALEPIAEFDGLFLRKGKITFWVSEINRRMVTCVEAKVKIGKVSVKLEELTGPGSDFWITHQK